MRSRVMRASLVTLLAASAVSVVAAEQSPDLKRLDYFAGKWRVDADVKATPLSAASTASGTDECEWFANLHMVCKAEAKGAAGQYKTMRVMSHMPALKQYSAYTVDSLGFGSLGAGTFQANTWTFTTELAGSKLRVTMKTSPDSYTAVSEYAGPDGKWVQTSEIKATRMK